MRVFRVTHLHEKEYSLRQIFTESPACSFPSHWHELKTHPFDHRQPTIFQLYSSHKHEAPSMGQILGEQVQMWANMASGVPSPNSFREQSPWASLVKTSSCKHSVAKMPPRILMSFLSKMGFKAGSRIRAQQCVRTPELRQKRKPSQFIQLLWAMTSKVGCGMATYEIDGDYVGFLSCFYVCREFCVQCCQSDTLGIILSPFAEELAVMPAFATAT
eukprot:TRINITY_DN642_c0_g4_i1.p1 TRINITY_DN642_c0_g4~~TRINITY_DN642_c0_g4_i1.p1  ORF type:complete len:216 (-),score=-0.91 TRINITY_DN642_c0_g4_i1:5-652(-)